MWLPLREEKEGNRKQNFLCFDCHLLVINQYFLREMKVVEKKKTDTERNSSKRMEELTYVSTQSDF